MDKSNLKKILTKANSLQQGKEVGLAKEFIILDEKLDNVYSNIEAILTNVKEIDEREVRTYENELVSLLESLKEIKISIENKDTIVNIPLDNLSESLQKIETSIKSIKSPEFPKEISVNNLNNSDIIKAIKDIPEFPIKEINSLVSGLESKLSELRFEVPEFDYTRIENKLKDIVDAIKKIKISGGGGAGVVTILNTSGNGINPATEEKQDTQITQITALPTTFNDEALWLLRRMVKLLESNATVDIANRQRVVVENTIAALGTYGLGGGGSNYPTVGAPIASPSTSYFVQTWSGPVDPRWTNIEQAKINYNTGVRNNLSFS